MTRVFGNNVSGVGHEIRQRIHNRSWIKLQLTVTLTRVEFYANELLRFQLRAIDNLIANKAREDIKLREFLRK